MNTSVLVVAMHVLHGCRYHHHLNSSK